MPSIKKNQWGAKVDTSEFDGKFAALGKRLTNSVVRRGLLAGAKVIGEEARRQAPQPRRSKRSRKKGPEAPGATGGRGKYATGNLAKSIGWESRGVFRDGSGSPTKHRAVVFIRKPRGGNRNARSYAHFPEFGTRPHRVGKISMEPGAERSGGEHPGSRPQPFMRPAFDTKADEALRTVRLVIARELERELVKLRTQRMGRRAS